MQAQIDDWKALKLQQFRDNTLLPSLKLELWKPEYAYNATHYLMPSLHGFAKLQDSLAIQAFHTFFQSFAQYGIPVLDTAKPLVQFHFRYLCSEYLCTYPNIDTASFQILQAYLYQSVYKTWITDSAARWSHSKSRYSYAPNMRWNVLWKLEDKLIQDKTYHKAITDDEMFVMATACNLIRSGMQKDSILSDIQNMMYRCLQQNGKFDTDGTWLFQAGFWSNYKDYRYAGHTAYLGESIRERRVKNIAEDASHSLRYPLWLLSLEQSLGADSTRSLEVYKIRKGFAAQAMDKVIRAADSSFPWPLLRNYMDGNNGMYRWHYNGRPGGVLPYGNSATFWLGWWGYFPKSSAAVHYEAIVVSSIRNDKALPSFNIAPETMVFPGIQNKQFLLLNSLLASIPGGLS